MLLTSGQVSVAISSFIVFIFTTALFLSGYVLQQQTVRDLRAAIKPQDVSANDRLYLPSQFIVHPTPSPTADKAGDSEGVNEQIKAPEGNIIIAEVNELNNLAPTGGVGQEDKLVLGAGAASKIQKTRRPPEDYPVILKGEQEQKPLEQQNQEEILEKASSSLPQVEKVKEEKQLSRAERRRKIKEEILDIGEGDGFKGYRRRMW